MNAVLRTSFAVWSIVFAATTIPASLLSATPLHYQIDMVVQSYSLATPFDGATLKLDLTWDASTLPPPALPFVGSDWPTSNTIGSLTVSGSAAVDGVYSPTFPYPDGASRWRTFNQGSHGDSLQFPIMWFEIGGQTIEFASLFHLRFVDTFFEGRAPFFPKPFGPADLKKVQDQMLFYIEPIPRWVGGALPVSASARYVPEPTTLATASFAFISLVAFRRRK